MRNDQFSPIVDLNTLPAVRQASHAISKGPQMRRRLEEPCAIMQKVEKVDMPVLTQHGALDKTIPLQQSEMLHAKVASKVKVRAVVASAGHGDLTGR